MATHGAQGLLPALTSSVGEPGMWSARSNESLTAWLGFLLSNNEWQCPLCDFLGKIVLVSFQLIIFPASLLGGF